MFLLQQLSWFTKSFAKGNKSIGCRILVKILLYIRELERFLDLRAMKKITFCVLIQFLGLIIHAQCPFDPIITPASLSLCPNSSDTLFTQPAMSHLWYKNGNPILGSNSSFLVVSQIADAGATFLVVSTNAGCSEPSPSVLVSNQAIPPISISIVDDLSPISCSGETRFLTVNDPFNVNIRWFRDGVQLVGQTNDTLAAIQGGNYSVIAFSDACPNNSQTSPIQSVSYINSPTPTITFIPSNLTLNTTVSGATIQWYIDGNLIAGAIGQTFLPLQNGIVTVQATYADFCVRTSPDFAYNSFVADCDHNPVITPNDLVLCPNSSDTLFALPGDSYQWFKDGSAIAGANDSFIVVSSFSDAGSQFSVEVTVNECSEVSPEVLVDGWVFLPITVSTEGLGKGSLCEGDTLLLQVNQPFTENIRWFKNGNLLPSETDDSLIITNSGVYTVTAATSICPLFEETSLNLEYTFLSNPQPVISYFSVSNTMAVDVIGLNYSWSVDSQVIPDLMGQIITPTILGNYSVEVNYANGCSNISEPLAYDPVGIETLQNQTLSVYPNPTTHNLNFTAEEKGHVYMYDNSGALVFSQELRKGSVLLNIAELRAGIYSMKFVSNRSSKRAIIIKHEAD
jgi:hypothetical protein